MTKQISKINYTPTLGLLETECAIKYLKDCFEKKLSRSLNLVRVSAPLFVSAESGLNDNLNGVERPVSFDIRQTGEIAEVVHSLAKWKRYALHRYHMPPSCGIYTDMNAIRRDEKTDELHSVYVDQWDWEKVITAADRNIEYLKDTVRKIYAAVYATNISLKRKFKGLCLKLPRDITFITSQQLEDMYPDLSPSERENTFAKKYGAIFVMQIGGKLRSGNVHDGRAPDYDDWNLNGDILIYYPPLKRAVEISSMGIRVDSESLIRQLEISGQKERASLPFHSALLKGELPLTVGGGIGQSRLCMLILNKVHVGEVQASLWPSETLEKLKERNVTLL